ncbi:MAG: hypothetical protein U0176_22525 [Bacteroidia bacterium]
MRRFLLHIALFLLPFLGLLAWLLIVTPEREWSYRMIQKDCRTGDWIYRRLHQVEAPVDVAFVGTSKTMCNVNDSLIEYRLHRDHGRSLRIANFGVCRMGENLHWLIARDILQHKGPRHLIVEVSAEMATNSHFHFPYMATAGEAIGAPLWANSDYLYDLTTLAWNRLVYQREHLLGIERQFGDQVKDSLHSFLIVGKDGIADSSEMAGTHSRRVGRLSSGPPTGIKRWIYDAEAAPPKHYYRAMADLCQAHGTQLTFLYLPIYGTERIPPFESAFLQTLGAVWMPPDSVFGDPKLYFDNSHLNMQGARNLSDWLTRQVASLP